MEQLQNGFTLQIPEGCFPLSTDSMLLADFPRLPKNAKVLDLGSGCGTLGTLLCAKWDNCTVTGIEIETDAHNAALENAHNNNLTSRLFSICQDLNSVSETITPGSFDCCISNPPYYHNEPQSKTLSSARQGVGCSMDTLFQAAAWALRFGGDFFLVHKPEKLSQLCACATAAGLEPKRLCLIRHKPQQAVNLILLQCRKGGKPGLIWEEQTLFNPDGSPTDYYQRIYHL